MPDPQFTPVDHDPFTSAQFEPVDHDPFSMQFAPVDHDPFAAASMTHWGPDPVAEDIGRRTRQVGQNLWNTYTAPFQAAKQLGTAATSGTLDVTDPATAGNAFDLVTALAGGRAPFAGAGELGATGGNPFWIEKPALAKKIDKLTEQGFGTQAIADELSEPGVSRSGVRRYLEQSGQKTAAAENFTPGVLGDLGNDEVIKAGLARGDSYETIARRIGTSPGNVFSRAARLRDAGELSGIQLRPSAQSQSLLADPVKRADLIRLAKEGTSQGDIASYFFGGPGGKHPRRGAISQFIKQLQEEGELLDYVPQGGSGITPAGRTPTLPQLRSLQAPPGPAPLTWDDIVRMRNTGAPGAEKALREYMKSRGLSALQLPVFG